MRTYVGSKGGEKLMLILGALWLGETKKEWTFIGLTPSIQLTKHVGLKVLKRGK